MIAYMCKTNRIHKDSRPPMKTSISHEDHAHIIIIIIMYIYHALINALSAHMIRINLNMIFYTHVKHSPTKTIYIKYLKF